VPDPVTSPFRPVPGGKVAIPRLPGIFVSRARLGVVLDRATTRPVTVVRAPAGAGKTTALAGWAGDGRAVAWVSLDQDDNDESRLWTAILCALRRCPVVPADGVLHRLGPPGPGRRSAFLADLEDAFAGVDHPVRLVLDDLQELSQPEPLDALAALARQLPPGLRLVLATRVEPRLRLARLHVEGALSRVGGGRTPVHRQGNRDPVARHRGHRGRRPRPRAHRTHRGLGRGPRLGRGFGAGSGERGRPRRFGHR
jgi:LuxR family maltose regulon positive regulatory protein